MTEKMSGVIATECECGDVECLCYEDAVEVFVSETRSFFEDIETYAHCPTHTIERHGSGNAETFRTPKDFLRYLTNRISGHTIRWTLTDKDLRVVFSHHGAPTGMLVVVTPIQWVQCKNVECVEISASHSFQHEILREKPFRWGYCTDCAKDLKAVFETLPEYRYEVTFTFASGDTYTTNVMTQLEPYPDAWWMEIIPDTAAVTADSMKNKLEQLAKEIPHSCYYTLNNEQGHVAYVKFIVDEQMVRFHERKLIVDVAIAQSLERNKLAIANYASVQVWYRP